MRTPRRFPHALMLGSLVLALAGCVTAPPPAPAPAPYEDRFQPVPDYTYLPSPTSEGEREVLARLEHELTLIERLVREAQAQSNPDTRVKFRYDLLNADLEAMRGSIRRHLQGPSTEPRFFKPLRGDYRG